MKLETFSRECYVSFLDLPPISKYSTGVHETGVEVKGSPKGGGVKEWVDSATQDPQWCSSVSDIWKNFSNFPCSSTRVSPNQL